MRRLIAWTVAIGMLAGCGEAPKPAPPNPPTPPSAVEPAAKAAPDAAAPKAGETVRRKAEPGVGERGRGLDPGPVTTPIAARFAVQEKLAFAQVTEALNIYKALNGRVPKSHEEFVKEIIEANQIKLPPLPAGQQYKYDPKEGELMVEQPGGK